MPGLDEIIERALRSRSRRATGVVDWTPIGFFGGLECPSAVLRCYINPHSSNSVGARVEVRVLDGCPSDECRCTCLSGKDYELDCSTRRVAFRYKGVCVEVILRG